MAEKNRALEYCKTLVEHKLSRGDSADWSGRDFAELSERVFAETGLHLSATTLKRLWGKVEYRSEPHPDTLDALARFAGFEHWRSLKQQVESQTPPGVGGLREKAPARWALHFKSRSLFKFLPALALLLGVAALLAYRWSRPPVLKPADFSFSSRPLSRGIPNSVVFLYDAHKAPPGDSIFIQQSWDRRRRVPVARTGREHTSIYYFPGYFMAKLVVGEQVVRQHKLFIPTEGWLAYIDQSPVPVYLDSALFNRGDTCLEVLPEVVAAHNIALQPEAPEVTITNVRQYDSLTTADFLFEAEVRNYYAEGSAICRMTEVALLTTRGPLVIPLAEPGCAGALRLHIPHRNIRAAEADLSGFGCDLSRWVPVRCSTRAGQIFIEVNGREVYRFRWPGERPSEIFGVQFNFKGGGAVRNVRLEDWVD